MKNFLFLTICLSASISCFSQKSSLIVGISDARIGQYTSSAYFNGVGGTNTPITEWKPGIGLNLGYQFNFGLSDRFSIDATILGKAQQGKVNTYTVQGEKITPYSDKSWLWGAAVNGIINYRIWHGMHVGIGVEPTLFFHTDKIILNQNKQLFDCPIIVKLGYRFKNQMEIATYYKHGFKSLYENNVVTDATKNKELAISFSVPLFK